MHNQQHDPALPSDDLKPTAPPKTLATTVAHLGPGMIVAGSIVGSGELIATTKVGAEAGFWLLWLIVVGCVIKVFTQVEFGRYTITHSQTPLKALDTVPGPRWRVNWIVWYWAIMTVLVVTQQGGIVGGVGQALAISYPLTTQGAEYNRVQDEMVDDKIQLALVQYQPRDPASPEIGELQRRIAASPEIGELQRRIAAHQIKSNEVSSDAAIWACVVTVITCVLLYVGRYGFIQVFSTVLVGAFTLVTLVTLGLLQTKPEWAVTTRDLAQGFSFRFPPAAEALVKSPLATAFAAFGLIGVGSAELIMYPYWCLEKGYAKFTGPRDASPAWAARAQGWLRVLYVDAWASMVVYTLATVAFYLLGAAVLGRVHLNPSKDAMVRTLAEMYVPVFGSWAQGVFLFGALAVLYSTFFVAAAGMARVVADGMGLFGLHDGSERTRMRWTRVISVLWPLLALIVYLFVKAPTQMILACGVSQAVMLPMLGFAAIFFRYRRCERALRPGRLWDLMLWLSFCGYLVAGSWAFWSNVKPLLVQV